MEEYYTIWVRSANRLSGDTNDFYYNIGGILPQDITYFKVQVLEYIIPYHGINTYNSQAFEIRVDFGGSSIYHHDTISETSLIISNLKDYFIYFDNANGVDYLENKSEFNIKPGPKTPDGISCANLLLTVAAPVVIKVEVVLALTEVVPEVLPNAVQYVILSSTFTFISKAIFIYTFD